MQKRKTSSLAGKLSAYSLAAGAVLLVPQTGQAQVAYSGPQNLDLTASVNLDLDGNGVDDLSVYFFAYNNFYGYVMFDGNSVNKVARGAGGMEDLINFTAGTIGPDLGTGRSWAFLGVPNSFNHTNYGGNFNDTTGYMGVMFKIDGQDHYGWIRYTGKVQPFGGTIVDWAYEDQAGTAITVGDAGLPEATASAGPDQNVNEGANVTLDGSASTGAVTYAWTQTGGPAVVLSDPAAVQPIFVAPACGAEGAELVFELTAAGNDGLEATDTVTVNVAENGIAEFPAGVVSGVSSTGRPVGIEMTSGGGLIQWEAVDPTGLPGVPESMPYGLLSFRVRTDVVGGTVQVTIHLPATAPEGYGWWKYSAASGWSEMQAAFNEDRTQVTFAVTDGGAGDQDGAADGFITDPCGLGGDERAPEVVDISGSSGCFVETLKD